MDETMVAFLDALGSGQPLSASETAQAWILGLETGAEMPTREQLIGLLGALLYERSLPALTDGALGAINAADAIDGRLLGNRGRAAAAADTTTTSTRAAPARDGAGGRRRRLRDAVFETARGPHVGRARRDARAPRPFGVRRRAVSDFIKTHREQCVRGPARRFG